MDGKVNEGRRKFLREAGRWLLGAGLIGGLGALIERDPEQCVNRGLCSGCAEFDNCGLPQALSAKQALTPGPSVQVRGE